MRLEIRTATGLTMFNLSATSLARVEVCASHAVLRLIQNTVRKHLQPKLVSKQVVPNNHRPHNQAVMETSENLNPCWLALDGNGYVTAASGVALVLLVVGNGLTTGGSRLGTSEPARLESTSDSTLLIANSWVSSPSLVSARTNSTPS